MNAETFRAWLRERGCSFEEAQPRDRGAGHAAVTVRREGHSALLPMAQSRQDLDPRTVHEIVEALRLDPEELPRHRDRV